MKRRTKEQIEAQVSRINAAIAELQEMKRIDKIQAKVFRKKLKVAKKMDLVYYCNLIER